MWYSAIFLKLCSEYNMDVGSNYCMNNVYLRFFHIVMDNTVSCCHKLPIIIIFSFSFFYFCMLLVNLVLPSWWINLFIKESIEYEYEYLLTSFGGKVWPCHTWRRASLLLDLVDARVPQRKRWALRLNLYCIVTWYWNRCTEMGGNCNSNKRKRFIEHCSTAIAAVQYMCCSCCVWWQQTSTNILLPILGRLVD